MPQPLIPQAVRRVVAMIYHEREGEQVPVGTGFFLSYRNPAAPEAGPNYDFLVTARHLVFDKEGNRNTASVRLNRNDQGTELIPITDDRAFVAADESIDVAVLPGRYVDAPVNPLYLQADEFVAREDDLALPGYGVGADVFYIGLFNPILGEARNQPITRFGRIALIPDERVWWEDEFVRVIVAEISAFGGTSGSPVFIFLGHQDHRGLPVPRLLGILKGSFTQKLPAELVDIDAKLLVTNVVGVAAIVPAFLLDDFIRQHVIPEIQQEEGAP